MAVRCTSASYCYDGDIGELTVDVGPDFLKLCEYCSIVGNHIDSYRCPACQYAQDYRYSSEAITPTSGFLAHFAVPY